MAEIELDDRKILVKDLKGMFGKIHGDEMIIIGEKGTMIRQEFKTNITREEARSILGLDRKDKSVSDSTEKPLYTREEAHRILFGDREDNSNENSTERQF